MVPRLPGDEDTGTKRMSALPLDGLRVCFLRHSDYSTDARARKQLTALTEAGAKVTLVGVGVQVAEDLMDYDVRLLEPQLPPGLPRLGQEEVWWPVRVAVNLAYTRTVRRRFFQKRLFSRADESSLVDLLTRLKPDVIHAYNVQTLPMAMRIKEKLDARVIYDVRDLYWDRRDLEHTMKEQLGAAESRLIGAADAVITVCEPLAEILESRHGIPRPTVVYNGPLKVMDAPSPVHTPMKILFQGAYSHSRNLSALIEAASKLQGRATLTLQGFGGNELELRDQVVKSGLEDVVCFVPPAPPLDVVQSAATYDVGVICYKGATPNLRSAVPNKLMDYLGAGLALAVSDLPGHRSVLEGTGAGVFINPESSTTIFEGLRRLTDRPQQVAEMKRSALEVARLYEWKIQADKLVAIYAEVVQRKRVYDCV